MNASRDDPAERSGYLRYFYRDWRPTRFGRIWNGAYAWASGLGLTSQILITLQVKSRSNGRLSSTVLVGASHEGSRYVVSMLGENSEWVKNVRATGGKVFIKRGRSRPAMLAEIPPEERAPILKAWCQVATSGRKHLPVPHDAPVSALKRSPGTTLSFASTRLRSYFFLNGVAVKPCRPSPGRGISFGGSPMFGKHKVQIRDVPGALLLGAVLLAAFAAHAQPYPSHPVRIVVPYAAGGAVDIVARTIGQPLSEALKQPVIVDNRPGASANIGMELVAKAAPDGYTLLMASNGIATNMALFPQLAFDGRRDFAPVAKIGYAPLVIVVPAASTAKSLKDLIAMAKAEPGKLPYASAGNGSSGHLAGELLKSTAKIDVLHVPYKGGAPAITDLLGERISFMPINPVEVIAHIRAGRLRALAVASDKRFPLLPDVPTVAEAGLPGFEASVWWGVVAPAKTAPEIIRQLNAETNKALANPAFASKLADLGVVVTPETPDQFAGFIKSQAELWSGVIKSAGIQPD